jgi:glutamyl-tRNA reductase
MNIFVLGLNHKTAPLSIREKISFHPQKLSQALLSLNNYPFIEENLILSTCNRVEIYVSSNLEGCIESIKNFISDFHNLKDDLNAYFYVYQGKDAIRHLFRVASSLDSLVIGENQILRQVKESYFRARDCEVVGRITSLLFEEAIKVGRIVRTETDIGKGAVSISTAAIELAKQVLYTLSAKKVLIVGVGKIGELTLKNLALRGVQTICVANRTYERAQGLAKVFGARAIKFDSLSDALEEVDIVISSSSAPHLLIKRSLVEKIMVKRTSPLFFIDLGVPRNVEESIAQVENVYLYNIDDLIAVRERNLAKRLKEIKKVEGIIERQVDYFIRKIGLVEYALDLKLSQLCCKELI